MINSTLENMKLGTKLQIVFLLISLIGFIVAGIGIYNMGEMNEKTELMYKRELMGLSHIKDANIDLIYMGRARGEYLASETEENRSKYKKVILESLSKMKDNLSLARPLFISAQAKELFAQYEKSIQEYEEELTIFFPLAEKEELKKKSPELENAMKMMRERANFMDATLLELSHLKEKRAKDEYEMNNQFYQNSRLFMLILVVSSTFSGVIIGVLMTNRVKRQLGGDPKYASVIASKIADGDLNTEVVVSEKDNSSLLFAMKKMQEKLLSMISEIQDSSENIKHAACEISNGNMELSGRTEEQASSLEETASSMEEMASTVENNTKNAQQGGNLAKQAFNSAQIGNDEMNKVISTINDIHSSSSKMVDIISVVESIAFQTNILALNAAVEAARAGEQGRGFAVVASEVRNLAQRSASASKEIKELIENSVSKINIGTVQAQKANDSMQHILEDITKVNGIMQEISIASNEQNMGIQQISHAIMQMDGVTQSNAALVEEAAAAAQSLEHEATRLNELLNIFNVDK